ncbi:MAG TPA: alpha/beta hydrolase [Catenuloplanes sp.]
MATFILVPGMWLGGWAWRDVTAALRQVGHEVYPLTLTGVADRAHLAGPGIDLDTHTEDIVGLVRAEDLRDVVLVGHSYAGLPVTAAAERIPERLSRVVYVDSGPLPAGTAQLDLLTPGEQTDTESHLIRPRPWEPADDPLLAGLDEAALSRLRARATGHPLASVSQPLRRTPTGIPVPMALVACVFPADQVTGMIAARHPMFAGLAGAEIVGLPTGHWPMLSEPKALAGILDRLAP